MSSTFILRKRRLRNFFSVLNLFIHCLLSLSDFEPEKLNQVCACYHLSFYSTTSYLADSFDVIFRLRMFIFAAICFYSLSVLVSGQCSAVENCATVSGIVYQNNCFYSQSMLGISMSGAGNVCPDTKLANGNPNVPYFYPAAFGNYQAFLEVFNLFGQTLQYPIFIGYVRDKDEWLDKWMNYINESTDNSWIRSNVSSGGVAEVHISSDGKFVIQSQGYFTPSSNRLLCEVACTSDKQILYGPADNSESTTASRVRQPYTFDFCTENNGTLYDGNFTCLFLYHGESTAFTAARNECHALNNTFSTNETATIDIAKVFRNISEVQVFMKSSSTWEGSWLSLSNGTCVYAGSDRVAVPQCISNISISSLCALSCPIPATTTSSTSTTTKRATIKVTTITPSVSSTTTQMTITTASSLTCDLQAACSMTGIHSYDSTSNACYFLLYDAQNNMTAQDQLCQDTYQNDPIYRSFFADFKSISSLSSISNANIDSESYPVMYRNNGICSTLLGALNYSSNCTAVKVVSAVCQLECQSITTTPTKTKIDSTTPSTTGLASTATTTMVTSSTTTLSTSKHYSAVETTASTVSPSVTTRTESQTSTLSAFVSTTREISHSSTTIVSTELKTRKTTAKNAITSTTATTVATHSLESTTASLSTSLPSISSASTDFAQSSKDSSAQHLTTTTLSFNRNSSTSTSTSMESYRTSKFQSIIFSTSHPVAEVTSPHPATSVTTPSNVDESVTSGQSIIKTGQSTLQIEITHMTSTTQEVYTTNNTTSLLSITSGPREDKTIISTSQEFNPWYTFVSTTPDLTSTLPATYSSTAIEFKTTQTIDWKTNATATELLSNVTMHSSRAAESTQETTMMKRRAGMTDTTISVITLAGTSTKLFTTTTETQAEITSSVALLSTDVVSTDQTDTSALLERTALPSSSAISETSVQVTHTQVLKTSPVNRTTTEIRVYNTSIKSTPISKTSLLESSTRREHSVENTRESTTQPISLVYKDTMTATTGSMTSVTEVSTTSEIESTKINTPQSTTILHENIITAVSGTLINVPASTQNWESTRMSEKTSYSPNTNKKSAIITSEAKVAETSTVELSSNWLSSSNQMNSVPVTSTPIESAKTSKTQPPSTVRADSVTATTGSTTSVTEVSTISEMENTKINTPQSTTILHENIITAVSGTLINVPASTQNWESTRMSEKTSYSPNTNKKSAIITSEAKVAETSTVELSSSWLSSSTQRNSVPVASTPMESSKTSKTQPPSTVRADSMTAATGIDVTKNTMPSSATSGADSTNKPTSQFTTILHENIISAVTRILINVPAGIHSPKSQESTRMSKETSYFPTTTKENGSKIMEGVTETSTIELSGSWLSSTRQMNPTQMASTPMESKESMSQSISAVQKYTKTAAESTTANEPASTLSSGSWESTKMSTGSALLDNAHTSVTMTIASIGIETSTVELSASWISSTQMASTQITSTLNQDIALVSSTDMKSNSQLLPDSTTQTKSETLVTTIQEILASSTMRTPSKTSTADDADSTTTVKISTSSSTINLSMITTMFPSTINMITSSEVHTAVLIPYQNSTIHATTIAANKDPSSIVTPLISQFPMSTSASARNSAMTTTMLPSTISMIISTVVRTNAVLTPQNPTARTTTIIVASKNSENVVTPLLSYQSPLTTTAPENSHNDSTRVLEMPVKLTWPYSTTTPAFVHTAAEISLVAIASNKQSLEEKIPESNLINENSGGITTDIKSSPMEDVQTTMAVLQKTLKVIMPAKILINMQAFSQEDIPAATALNIPKLGLIGTKTSHVNTVPETLMITSRQLLLTEHDSVSSLSPRKAESSPENPAPAMKIKPKETAPTPATEKPGSSTMTYSTETSRILQTLPRSVSDIRPASTIFPPRTILSMEKPAPKFIATVTEARVTTIPLIPKPTQQIIQSTTKISPNIPTVVSGSAATYSTKIIDQISIYSTISASMNATVAKTTPLQTKGLNATAVAVILSDTRNVTVKLDTMLQAVFNRMSTRALSYSGNEENSIPSITSPLNSTVSQSSDVKNSTALPSSSTIDLITPGLDTPGRSIFPLTSTIPSLISSEKVDKVSETPHDRFPNITLAEQHINTTTMSQKSENVNSPPNRNLAKDASPFSQSMKPQSLEPSSPIGVPWPSLYPTPLKELTGTTTWKRQRGKEVDPSTASIFKDYHFTPPSSMYTISTVEPDMGCQWAEWEGITPCTVTCGFFGLQNRSRSAQAKATAEQCKSQTGIGECMNMRACVPMTHTEALVGNVLRSIGCTYIISLSAISLGVYLLGRSRSTHRILQALEDATLCLAHIFIVLYHDRTEKKTMCKLTSLVLQYLFMSNFYFNMLEAMQNYLILTNVGTLNSLANLKLFVFFGLVYPLVPTAVIASYWPHVPSLYSCWLNLGENLALSSLIHLIGFSCAGIIIVESAHMNTGLYSKYSFMERKLVVDAGFSQASLIFKLPLNLTALFLGIVTVYYQRFPLYPFLFGSNVALGTVVLWFHLLQEQKVRDFLVHVFGKVTSSWK